MYLFDTKTFSSSKTKKRIRKIVWIENNRYSISCQGLIYMNHFESSFYSMTWRQVFWRNGSVGLFVWMNGKYFPNFLEGLWGHHSLAHVGMVINMLFSENKFILFSISVIYSGKTDIFYIKSVLKVSMLFTRRHVDTEDLPFLPTNVSNNNL